MGPAASGPADSFPGCSLADIKDPKVSVPISVPASIIGVQLRNCELSGKVSARALSDSQALYGLTKGSSRGLRSLLPNLRTIAAVR